MGIRFSVAAFKLHKSRAAPHLLLAISCLMPGGCCAQHINAGADIEFIRVPPADEGGPEKLDVIEGRVVGAHPELQMFWQR